MRRPAGRPAMVAARHAVLAILVFAAGGGAAAAQQRQFGVRGGATLATVSNQSSLGSTTFDVRSGLVAGGFVTAPLRWVDLQPEVLYTSKGALLREGGVDSRLVLDYLELPILARRPIGRIGAMRLAVAAGPAFAVRLSARTRTSFGGATEDVDLRDEVERYDVGAVLAGALNVGAVVVDARYTHGFRDIDRDGSDAVAVRNRAVTISAGIRF